MREAKRRSRGGNGDGILEEFSADISLLVPVFGYLPAFWEQEYITSFTSQKTARF
jgi:hypothetical protein